jgi:hypothetical protein
MENVFNIILGPTLLPEQNFGTLAGHRLDFNGPKSNNMQTYKMPYILH